MYKEFRLFLSSGLLLIFFSSLVTATTSEESFETVHTSNAAVLNRLGLTPLQIPDGHHKKRLAGPEPPGLSSQTRIHQPYSRRHGHRDSHVYIVKLPASPPYYTITKPHKSVNDDKVTKTGPSFPVGFQGNGKPAKIYHWNLPVVKKMMEKKRLQLSQLRIDARKKLEDIKKQQQTSSTKTILNKLYPLDTTSKSYEYRAADNQFHLHHQKQPVTKHIRNNDKRLSYSNNDNDNIKFKSTKKNNLGNKAFRLDDLNVHRIHMTNELHGSRNTVPKMKKHRKKAATSYYAPIATKTGSTSIHKNFPGNGKPKAFYIMEKSRKPVYYHPLLNLP
ncbi:PREDICTED: uncharacterized protein LOC108779104 [Cyphomyrmex costatus]|uniref:uncharacterized protein LOC108779104 n=1 Tax=Cyphomyrmex costatus TaxID=456900 RepID=UPI0008524502|nr:PREDICTED: uncharacterized protein LOC108779104 [Cyphomyrmex costatus]